MSILKTISIFVSSTFKDMDLERDCLNLYIVPKLNEYFNPKGYYVQLIDLRWGISTEDTIDEKSKEQAILNTCLNVIDNCRPFFIGFVGKRYGWIPPIEVQKSNIHKVDLDEIAERNLSVTQLEIEYGILQKQLFSTSLLFLRSEESYKGLSADELESFSYDDEVSKNILKSRTEHLIQCFDEAGYNNHIVEYTIPLSYRHILECSDFINLIFTKLVSLIDYNIRDKESQANLEDWISRLLLSNYIPNGQFILETLNEINENRDVILYGSGNSGKTSISLYLKTLLRHLNKDIHILYYSPQLQGETPITYLLKLWTNAINERCSISEFASPESAWKSFISVVDNTNKHIVVIIDSYDNVDDMLKSNFMLTHPSNLHFILTSSSQLKNWEIFKQLRGRTIPFLDNKSAQLLIDNICKEYNKTLPTKVKQEILKSRANSEGLYSAGDLKRILTILLNFTKNDFLEIRNATGAPEDNIENYLLKTISSFSTDIKEQSQFLISRMNIDYSFDDLTPFFLIALSKVGLNESELFSCLKSRFNLITFSLIRHFISSYLAPKNDSCRWLFADKYISEALTQTLSNIQKEEFYRLLAIGLNNDLKIYYAINSKSASIIIDSLKNIHIEDDDSISLIHSNVFQSYLEGNSIIQVLTNSHMEFAMTNIESLLDIITFSFPRVYITGHGNINKFEYYSDLINLLETLTDKNCGDYSNKCYYLGVAYMCAASAISRFTLDKSDKIKGLSLYEQSINYFEQCDDDSIMGHIELCHNEIRNIQSSM